MGHAGKYFRHVDVVGSLIGMTCGSGALSMKGKIRVGQCDGRPASHLGAPAAVRAAVVLLPGDYYLFDEFQTSQVRTSEPRHPECNNLYDVFINIRDDEGEHVKTMAACQDMTIMSDLEVRRETERRL